MHSITTNRPTTTAPAEALELLRWWLLDHHYSSWATDRILAHLEASGELASAVAAGLLDADDEGPATEAYVAALPAVPFDDPAWGTDEDLDGLDLPPIAGGGPDPDDERWWAEQARLADERSEALADCRRLDALAELRAAEDRAELRYGWE